MHILMLMVNLQVYNDCIILYLVVPDNSPLCNKYDEWMITIIYPF